MMKICNLIFPNKIAVKLKILCSKLIKRKCSTNLLIFPFIRAEILSTLAQLAHEELFKIMNFSFKLSHSTTLTQDNTFQTFL